jgi:hypothetical protein
MGSKFLNSLHGESLSALTNGTASLFLKSLKINDLEDSKNVVVDDKFLTTGSGASDLIFINSDDHTSPGVGFSKIYFKTDGNLYKKNNLGEENTLAGGYSLITVSTDELNDIDYKTDLDKITWTNTTLNTHNFYNYYNTPHKPKLRTPFIPLDNRATNVFTESDLELAINEEKDNIFIAGDFSITSAKFIGHSCKVSGDPDAKPTITAVNILTSLFNVSADDVFFENIILENANTSGNCNCIYFGLNDEAKNCCVHNCVLRTNEFAITSDHYQIQIYNNQFEFIGGADSHRYIYLIRCRGEVLIYENTFSSNGTTGSPSTACMLISTPGGSGRYENGHLVIYKNSSVGIIQRMAIVETEPINFKLSLLENTIDTNTDFFILYGATMLNGFSEITAYGNTVTLMPTSSGFKGLVGWDTPSSGGEITYCPIIRGSLNNLPSNLRLDYSPMPNLANILCYKNTMFTTSLEVPLNPPLVAFGESAEGIVGPDTTVDNSLTFFDGTTGKILKENTNFKFITGATYGDQLKVPDIETDDHLSLNEELKSMDTAITTNTTNNTGSVTVHSDVSSAGSGAIITASERTAITTNTTNNTGSVTVHSDVSSAGSGAIITEAERNNISSNVSKLVNTSAVQFPNPITTIVGELDVSKIKSYQHNVELEFNDTDVILTCDNFITNSTNIIALTANEITLSGVSTTDQTTFTADQQIVSKKYVDDANDGQNTAIGSNTTKTQNITASSGITTFAGTISSSNVKATNKIAIGTNAGTVQEADAIAIGTNTGLEQKCCAVAIGRFSGSITQQKDTIGIGNSAGYTNQQEAAIALGYLAGGYTQGVRSIAIGYKSGETNQGAGSIAIGDGAGINNQAANSIVLNAGSTGLNATTTGTFIKPMRNQTATDSVFYNSTTGELSYSPLDLSGISGSVTVHSDVTSAGSGAIITGIERDLIASNTEKTQYMSASMSDTTFYGTISADNMRATDSVGIGNASGIGQETECVAIGLRAGATSQKNRGVAIGYEAGQTDQKFSAVAVGPQSGTNNQGNHAVAVGSICGYNSQGDNCVAIGNNCARDNQGAFGVAIGSGSGRILQGTHAVAIGRVAGNDSQGASCVAIGAYAGQTNQPANSIVINATGVALNPTTTGTFIKPMRNETSTDSVFYNSTTGELSYSASINDAVQNITATANNTTFAGNISSSNVKATAQVAIGNNSGTTSQGTFTVAIGNNAGTTSQLTEAIAIGPYAGNSNQGKYTVAVGGLAGAVSQQDNGVSIGTQAGRFTQGLDGVAIGFKCGYSNQSANSVAIGKFSGNSTQGTNSVAVGTQSGQTTQGAYCVALGEQAGSALQGQGSIAIGSICAKQNQGLSCVAVGNAAAENFQGNGGVAVGNQAGRYIQGASAVAIGAYAGNNNQPANSIVINASGAVLNGAQANSTFIRPMREVSSSYQVFYNPTTYELTYFPV